MSRFYADIEGSRGPASRMGTPNSGMRGHIRGWNVGANVSMSTQYGNTDRDECAIRVTTGSGGYGAGIDLATARDTDKGVEITLADAFGGHTFVLDNKGKLTRKRKARVAA